jgi:hypothetical protein
MRPRSIFWPLVLIATGITWFLVDFGTLPSANLWALTYLLPYVLIALGVGLILRTRWAYAGMLVSALVVAGAMLAVVFAAPLGWNKAPSFGCAWLGDTPFEGCSFDLGLGGAVPGSGVVRSETRQLPDFTGVSVDYPAEVVIRQGEVQSVSVEAEDNLLPQLATRVTGGRLYIENRAPRSSRVDPTRPVRITLTVKDLHQLDAPSAGSVSVTGLQTDSLHLSVSGAGHVVLSGLDVSTLTVDLSGAGNIDADGSAGSIDLGISGFGSFRGGELAAQGANMDISGAGSATLWLKNELTANISGVGSVNYYGSPTVSQNVSGVGGVNRLGDK